MRTCSIPGLLAAMFVLCAGGIHAQRIRFDAESADFFRHKADHYRRWLDSTGLGSALRVKEVRLKKDSTELELLLRLNSTDLDTAVALWHRVEEAYRLSTGRPLEDELFRRFVSFMEIPSEQGNVQVYVLNTVGEYIPCFYVGIWEEEGDIKTDVHINQCRNRPIDIELKPIVLRKAAKGKIIKTRGRSADEVFDRIETFLRERYTPTLCYDRKPEMFVELRTQTTLRISISNLCRVVLTDETSSLWCRTLEALGRRCNDMRRERLEFEFYYTPDTNRLSGRLSGKFGSGVYKPRKSGYLDMEPDFSDYLEEFHVQFQHSLSRYLNR